MVCASRRRGVHDGNADETDRASTCQTASYGDGFIQAGVEASGDGNDIDDDVVAITAPYHLR